MSRLPLLRIDQPLLGIYADEVNDEACLSLSFECSADVQFVVLLRNVQAMLFN